MEHSIITGLVQVTLLQAEAGGRPLNDAQSTFFPFSHSLSITCMLLPLHGIAYLSLILEARLHWNIVPLVA